VLRVENSIMQEEIIHSLERYRDVKLFPLFEAPWKQSHREAVKEFSVK